MLDTGAQPSKPTGDIPAADGSVGSRPLEQVLPGHECIPVKAESALTPTSPLTDALDPGQEGGISTTDVKIAKTDLLTALIDVPRASIPSDDLRRGASLGGIARFAAWRPSPGSKKIFCGLGVLLLVAYLYMHSGRSGFNNAERSVRNAENELNRAYDRYIAANADPSALIPGTLPEPIKRRLYEQSRLSLALARDYLYNVKQFYKFYYASLFMAFITGSLAAIILVMTAREGWQNANDHMVLIFAVLAVASATFGVAPTVFKYEANLESNKDLYVQCAGVQGEIVTFALTFKEGATGQKSAGDFLRELDNRLSSARKVPLGFDPAKLLSPAQLSKGITGQN